jgi:acyl carrier protein
MNRDDIISIIEACLSEVLQRDLAGLQGETRLFDDLHLDSTSILELLMALEDAAHIEVDPEDLNIKDFQTLDTLADYVQANLSEFV